MTDPSNRVIDVPVPPCDLPPVSPRDLIDGWNAATMAAELAVTSDPEDARGFVFRGADGEDLGIVFADIDVHCWVSALDHTIGLDHLHGLAVCFRLLGLIDQMASEAWTREYYSVGGTDGPDIDAALLRTAARLPLNDDARFDPLAFRARADLEHGPKRLPSS